MNLTYLTNCNNLGDNISAAGLFHKAEILQQIKGE